MHRFFLQPRVARACTVLFALALLFGTLMPGPWKVAGTRPFAELFDLAAASHVALFALISFFLPLARFWDVRPWHVPTAGLALALLTEGLQFFAVERHPGLDGLAWDLLGTALGWSAGAAVQFMGWLDAPEVATAASRSPAPSRRR